MHSDELITKKDALSRLQISRSTFDRRKLQCLASPYKDAVVKNGGRVYIQWQRWTQFMAWLSDKEFKEKYGI
ncbi:MULTISPECIES: hypothetical protein [Lactobacillus]|uniref:DNA-binding protein n=1 Tax=Lactobacillus xujianguonis TaxID=2495899 RepID=A0A437SSI1_9LACO|nr:MULTISPECIES: hypothetical protein [Lactobacillus]RVU69812.1 hypothetical protein EJK17_11075 [Lactobacillus xujianguonis]RVU71944.1 hypothetical protein EJK20_11185 [Lactobacillus xujianguonis]